MKRLSPYNTSVPRQRGAVLVISLIMLVLITLLVTNAFTMSDTNLRAVGNMQFRDEAVAAANRAIEEVLSSPFSAAPSAESIDVDLDNDGNREYRVNFTAPTCVSAVPITAASMPPSSVLLGSAFVSTASNFYQTVWDLDASVTETSNSGGASVRVRQGVRVLLTQAQYNSVCSS